jgi:histidinol-phosphate aminotransferase
MYYLDRNEFQFELPPRCLAVLRDSSPDLLTHYSRSFQNNIKSPITERLSRIMGVPEQNILLGYGCEDLLMQIIQHFVAKGDGVLVAQYAWWYYKKIADNVAGVTYEFPVHKNKTTFRTDVHDVLRLAQKHQPKVILIANPNNPTGDSMSLEDLELLIRSLPESLVVIDESYWGYHDKANAHVPYFLQNYPNAVILRTFSKYYGLPGIRIGFGVIHSKHGQLINTSMRYLGFNQLSEKIALATLESSDYYETVNQTISSGKDHYCQELRPLPGVQVYDSNANFILISIPPEALPKLKTLFCGAEIAVRFFTNNGLESHFRVSLAEPQVNALVIQCIKEAVSC